MTEDQSKAMDDIAQLAHRLGARLAVTHELLVHQVTQAMLEAETKDAAELGVPAPKREDVERRARVDVGRRLIEYDHDHLSRIPPEHSHPRWHVTNTMGDVGEYAWQECGQGIEPDPELAEFADAFLDTDRDEMYRPFGMLMVPIRFVRYTDDHDAED